MHTSDGTTVPAPMTAVAMDAAAAAAAAADDDDDGDCAGCPSEFAACVSQLSDREKNQISNILA